MYEITEREPNAMDEFAENIKVYCDLVSRTCESLKDDLNQSKAYLKDANSAIALKELNKLCEYLQEGLPSLNIVASKLVEAAKPLHQAPSIFS